MKRNIPTQIFGCQPQIFICYIFAVGLILYYLTPTLNFRWGLIDDHELFFFLGPSKNVTFTQFFSILSQTEVSPDSVFTRYRPMYYILRIAELIIWGAEVSYWYLFRLLIAIVFALAITRFSLLLAGPVLTFGFIPFIFSSNYWLDVFGRAGTSEIYALLGFGFVLIPLCSILSSKSIKLSQSLLIALGVIIASGSKENFVFLVFIPLVLLLAPKIYKNNYAKFALLLPILFIIHIIFTLLGRLSKVSVDIYGNSISIGSKIGIFFEFFESKHLIFLTLIALSILILLKYGKFLRGKIEFSREFINHLIPFIFLELIFLGIYFSQFIFYGPIVNQSIRYAFPGIISLQFAILVGVAFLCSTAHYFGVRIKKIQIAKVVLILLAFSIFSPFTRLYENRMHLVEVGRSLKKVDDGLSMVSKILLGNPNISLILSSHSTGDYEPIIATNRILFSNQIKNRIGLVIDGYSSTSLPLDSLGYRLAVELEGASREGTNSPGYTMSPASTLDSQECFSIGFSGPPLKSCKYGGVTLWP